MGNCLVTKLKGTVDNNLLLKLGEFRIDFEGTGEVNQALEDLMSSSSEQVVLRALDGEFVDANLQPYSPSVTERTIVPGRNLDIRVSPNAKIAIGPKSTIIRLMTPAGSHCTIDLASLYLSEYADEISIRGTNAYGSVNNLPKNLSKFEFNGPSVYGHLASLLSQSQRINRFQIWGVNIEGTTATINNLAHPELMQRVLIVSCPKITGTLRDFGKMSILAVLTLGDRNQKSATPISGTVEDFAADQVNPSIGNRTSGGISVISNGIITYQGTAVAAGHYVNITYDSSLPNGYSVEIV